jgi:hypothetical protein
MDEAVSNRLLDQRLRNRMMEQLLCLVDWEDSIRWGAGEYFNSFFDFFPDRSPLDPNSALTEAEREALTKVLDLMNTAADSTSQHVTEAELVGAGWPERIKDAAKPALELMVERGQFSEEIEEDVPSSPPPWAGGGYRGLATKT